MNNTSLIDLSWNKGDLISFLPITLALLSFTLYWFIAHSEKIKSHFYSRYSFDTAAVKHIFFTKYIGFFSMGVLPFFVCLLYIPNASFTYFGLTFRSDTALFSLMWITILSVIVVPMAYFSAQKPKNLENYPQIRAKIWTRKTVFINAFGWFIYLFGYELLFRGTLLFPLVESIGVWPAIAVNIALYSATHIPKGLEETIGAIPLGLVLCILTLLSGTIWIAFIVHVVMAWTNSFTALHFHPDIHYTSDASKKV
jgi:membrane protease YdiL (CAAX protease family)